MPKIYREGALGALMDEYERAAKDLQKLLRTIDSTTYLLILDTKTKDKDCRSIENIMNHVVRAGYSYSNYIRKQFGEEVSFVWRPFFCGRKPSKQMETNLA